jgi:hypothetical protein
MASRKVLIYTRKPSAVSQSVARLSTPQGDRFVLISPPYSGKPVQQTSIYERAIGAHLQPGEPAGSLYDRLLAQQGATRDLIFGKLLAPSNIVLFVGIVMLLIALFNLTQPIAEVAAPPIAGAVGTAVGGPEVGIAASTATKALVSRKKQTRKKK